MHPRSSHQEDFMGESVKLAKRPEMVELFGQAEIEKYTIKPWTVTQFVKLSSILKQIAKALKEEGFDVSQADLQKISLDKDITAADIIKYLTISIDIVGPHVPELIAISVRIELSEAGEIEWGPALAITAKIIALNWDHIKNWLGQILGKDPKTLFLALQKKGFSLPK